MDRVMCKASPTFRSRTGAVSLVGALTLLGSTAFAQSPGWSPAGYYGYPAAAPAYGYANPDPGAYPPMQMAAPQMAPQYSGAAATNRPAAPAIHGPLARLV